jgi:hypothetical protein
MRHEKEFVELRQTVWDSLREEVLSLRSEIDREES